MSISLSVNHISSQTSDPNPTKFIERRAYTGGMCMIILIFAKPYSYTQRSPGEGSKAISLRICGQ